MIESAKANKPLVNGFIRISLGIKRMLSSFAHNLWLQEMEAFVGHIHLEASLIVK